MRAVPLIAVLSLSILTGCTTKPESVKGEAGPAGSPARTASATASASAPVTATPSRTAPATTSASPAAKPSPAGSASSPYRRIRSTDWANMTLKGLTFLDFGDATFRNGKASSGANTCTMLPGGARPAYAEYIAEEPANSPVTEDALILIECGSDGMDQALVPVQLAFDQRTRYARGVIPADPANGSGGRMTFTSYTIQSGTIVCTVRKADGSKETRRYRYDGGDNWGRY
ncbi:hypothetical protein ACL02O_04580 [Micromonospora sp. MS34]|uniref:hypothetical protein n=1 Tax=Micromonospora sp. MS34 TaxID=3385971 RepID=UPI0039A3E26C